MAQLANYAKFRAFDGENDPLVGGLVYSYVPGTSTPKATYTDHTLGTPNTNPVVLDALGEATIFIDGNTDIVLQAADASAMWGPIRYLDTNEDGTLTNATLAGTLTVTSTSVDWQGDPDHSGNHTFLENVSIEGNTTLGNSSSDTVSINADTLDFPNGTTISGDVEFADEVTLTPVGGTFTPGLTFGGGSTGMTFTSRSGRWQRLGDTIYFTLALRLFAKGSSTGTAIITGLPVAVSATSDSALAVEARGMGGLTGPPVAVPVNSSSTVSILYTSAVATGAQTAMTDANFTSASVVAISGSYQV
jgi:hypothetical protein